MNGEAPRQFNCNVEVTTWGLVFSLGDHCAIRQHHMSLFFHSFTIAPECGFHARLLELKGVKGSVVVWVAVFLGNRLIHPLNLRYWHRLSTWHSIQQLLLTDHELFVYIAHQLTKDSSEPKL